MTDIAQMVPDFTSSITDDDKQNHHLTLLVGGMRCASCAFMIEHMLVDKPDVTARVNVTEKRLSLSWKGDKKRFRDLLQPVLNHGYSLAVLDEIENRDQQKKEERFLLLCLAVAGFATGNIMLLSVGLWSSDDTTMGFATRDVMHWVSALIALPSILFAGQPFFRSAYAVLSKGHTNMDVPISLAVVLSSAMSIVQTSNHAEHTYFDSGVMLLFFLLIGRFLDLKARGKARSAARDLLLMMTGEATVLRDGKQDRIPVKDITEGMMLLAAAGEKIMADGVVTTGASQADTSLITGETMPQSLAIGTPVFAGMINLSAPITIKVSGARNETLLSEIISLMEKAEQGQAKYVRLADTIARAYTPFVHVMALSSFLGWLFLAHADWTQALLIAISVLIITCPCALGLAVPVVQVLASNLLFRKGILVKSSDALERMASIDTIVFDKTGTLTLGQPRLMNGDGISKSILQKAASLARYSNHPLAKALFKFYQTDLITLTAHEVAGQGIEASVDEKIWRLGQGKFCGVSETPADDVMELWFSEEGQPAQRFVFEDALRSDAIDVIASLKQQGYRLAMYSGDRVSVANRIGQQLQLDEVHGAMNPKAKHDALQKMLADGRKVMVVGDGLNDAAALSAATVSMSPSSAMDITQNAASMVFQGEKLQPVLTALHIAKKANQLVKQNFILALAYNLLAVPMAVMGYVTPLIAALAMSSSSILVILNALRLQLIFSSPKTGSKKS
ncbi:MAG: cadmium-translocating P-type ATPase [Alphaproteobacteria bacterium]|nr:cadmium-translocating P-type ATPase [Alphaproteobacteria bacterium]